MMKVYCVNQARPVVVEDAPYAPIWGMIGEE